MRYLGGCNEACVMPLLDAFASASFTAFVMPLFEYFNLTFLGVSHHQLLSFLLD